jgi:hypothetical protein
MNEICERCGFTWGSHHAGRSPWPYGYCPGHEGKMDWENGPGTVFKSTGLYRATAKEIEYVKCLAPHAENIYATKDSLWWSEPGCTALFSTQRIKL